MRSCIRALIFGRSKVHLSIDKNAGQDEQSVEPVQSKQSEQPVEPVQTKQPVEQEQEQSVEPVQSKQSEQPIFKGENSFNHGKNSPFRPFTK